VKLAFPWIAVAGEAAGDGATDGEGDALGLPGDTEPGRSVDLCQPL